MNFNTDYWQNRLDELRVAHRVPGATLAVLHRDQVHELASGVLNTDTDVEATPDSVFLAGSLAKAYTATAVLALHDRGSLDLDAPVRDVLPTFTTTDPKAAARITARQLLSHTGGLTCDFTFDSGRGDDCVRRYVEAAGSVAPDCPPGAAMSYSSVGYAVLGRMIEVLTGQTWDDALAELVLRPAGLDHTMTLPEEALRFRTAMGHLSPPSLPPNDNNAWPAPAPAWDLMPRSAGPYGRVIVSAGDLVRFARLHLANGQSPDGTKILSPESALAMRRREVDTIDRWTMDADGWGLGWSLYDWNGVSGFGHDGSAVAQRSSLRIVPDAGVAVALLANCDHPDRMFSALLGEVLSELAGLQPHEPFGPPPAPARQHRPADISAHTGIYEREGVRTTIEQRSDSSPGIRYDFTGAMSDLSPGIASDLVHMEENVWAAVGGFGPDPVPVIFHDLPDGTPCVVVGMRLTPMVRRS